MIPPMVSYLTFNRMGLTIRNLSALLKTAEDFELHIIDSNSKDDTWEFIQSLSDSRIKSKTKFEVNYGPIYGVNYNLARRKPDQYFITLDSDVCIYTQDWITRFMRVFEKFPEVGLLGVKREWPYPGYMPPTVQRERNGVTFLQLRDGKVGARLDFIPGHLQCLRPELIKVTGYWSEECHYGDGELSVRVNNYTPFKAGFVTDISIDMIQVISCDSCEGMNMCKLDRVSNTCFSIRNSRYKNVEFAHLFNWKYVEFFKELETGRRPVYCASIHDPESTRNTIYNSGWAQENFKYYADNAN